MTTFHKVLINPNFKALRMGEFAVADPATSEFIYEQGNASNIAKATLIEIAKANNFKISQKLSSEKFAAELDECFAKSKLPLVDKMTETQKVEQIVDAGIENGSSDDEMLIEVMQAGVSFKNALKLFKQVMERKGLRISTQERNKQIQDRLAEQMFNPESYQEIEDQIRELTEGENKIADTNRKQALGGIRKYCKANSIEIPKAPKKPRGSFRQRANEWIAANPLANSADFRAYLEENEKPENVVNRMVANFEQVHSLANAIIEARASE